MDWLTIILAVVGLVLLVVGAELLIKGASRLAESLGVSPLVVGLTVVAFGTSAPELAVSVSSAFAGKPDLALGNVVGSSIFNVLFILGISAIITPLVVNQKLLRLEVPLMIGSAGLVWLLGLDGRIGWVDGVILAASIVAYTVFAIRQSRKESAEIRGEYEEEFREETTSGFAHGHVGQIVFILAGLGMLVLGSQWLVDGAVMVASALGISELVIGLTVVAAGTSLPEVATSILATIRGERDIAVGNVVGSNIFNVFAVLGFSSLASPEGITVSPAALAFDIPIMLAVSIACLPIFFSGSRIARGEGFLFLAYYIAYTATLILSAQGGVPVTFSRAMYWFAIPLTVATLLFITRDEIRKRRTHGSTA